MLWISRSLSIPEGEIELNAIRAQGAGGQNVNKVASAIHLRFDIDASSLPGPVKRRLKALDDQRVSSDGVVVIKAQNHRSREQNRREALDRLAELVRGVAEAPRKRIPTRPGKGAKKRRLEEKKQRAEIKKLRRKPPI